MSRPGSMVLPAPRPALPAVLELLKPITWFPPMWAFSCGVVSSGVAVGERWWLVAGGHRPRRAARLRHEPGGQRLVRPACGRDQRAAAPDPVRTHSRALGPLHRNPVDGVVAGRRGDAGPWVFWASVLGLALAWAYSAPPLRLKRNGWWGNAAVGLSYEGLAWITGAAVMRWVPCRTRSILLLALLYSSVRTAS
jgi:chlorophyll/bacteriochlorophyll a synthase